MQIDRNKDLPEHLRQAIDLIAAVLRRIRAKRLDISANASFISVQAKGVATI